MTARAATLLALALALTGCGWDPPHGDLIVHNRSDEPVYVHLEGYGGEENLLIGPVAPGEDELFFTLPRGADCPGAGAFVLRDADGRELARRDNTTDPVCDSDPWVWHGPDPAPEG
jgi:hypothetical protein